MCTYIQSVAQYYQLEVATGIFETKIKDRIQIGILHVCTDCSFGQLFDLIRIVSYSFLSHKNVSLLKVQATRDVKF
jgi:hypothetical protein